MSDNTINIDTTQQPEKTINIADPRENTISLTPDANEYRSMNAAFGLGPSTGITKNEFSDAFASGNENGVREKAASTINANRIDFAKQKIRDYGYTLNDDNLRFLLKQQDPTSVVEEHYAKQWMDHLDRSGWTPDRPHNNLGSEFYMWQTSNPDHYDWVKQAGTDLVARQNYIVSNVQNAHQDTTWKDRVNTIVPDIFTLGIYGEYQMRTNAAETGTFTGGLGLGSNLEAQSQNMWNIESFDDWRKEFDRIYNSLPRGYREQWAQDMLYKSTGSQVFDNLMTMINASIFGKLSSNLGRNVLNPVTREAAWKNATFGTRVSTITIPEAQAQFQRIIDAVNSMSQPRPHGLSPNVAAPAAAGNIPESAVNIVTIDAINELNPNNNPLAAFINRVAALHDVDGTLAASNPGRLGREAANRLYDMFSAHRADYMDTVFNNLLQRVDRTPTAELQDRLRKIQLGLADLFRGPDNQVINVSRGIWLPGLNVRMFNLAAGTVDAELFGSIEEAKAVARTNGWAVKGDYAVGPDERLTLIRKENLIKSFRTQAANAKTTEGAAKANASADKLQAELDKVPRHDTGVTIESQFRQGPMYSSPIGPTRPEKPAGALKPTEGTPDHLDILAQYNKEAEKNQFRPTDLPKSRAQQIAEQGVDESALQRISNALGGKKTKNFFDENPNATFDDYIAWIKDNDGFGNQTAREVVDAVVAARNARKAKPSYPDISLDTDEHLLQYNTRKKMQREWEALTPEERTQMLSDEKPTDQFWGMPSEVIKQQGNGYYILHTVFLPENADFVRDGLLTSNWGGLSKEEFRRKLAMGEVSTGVPTDWAHGWVGALTNALGVAAPSEVMSIAENLNRNIATHGPSVLLGLLKRGLKPVEEIPLRDRAAFNRMLRFTQNAWNEETKTPGIWFDTMNDVDNWYRQYIGRGATEQDIRGYFAFKQAMIDDLNFRNMSVMTRKLAMGAKQHAIRFTDEYGQKVTTPFFEGVRLDNIPESGRALLVQPDGSKFNTIDSIVKYNPSVIQDIKEGRAQIIHLMNPSDRPLRGINKRPIDYVISYNAEEKPLGFNHVNRLGGGHLVPKWGWFLKQADVDAATTSDRDIRVYNGDKTLLSFQTRGQAVEAAQYLERVRTLLSRAAKLPEEPVPYDIIRWEGEGGATRDIPLSARDQLINEAALESQRTGIPFHKLYDMWMKPDAPFNVHEPIVAVPKGQKIINMGEEAVALRARHRTTRADGTKDDLVDATKGNSLLSQTMVEFTQERDAEGLYTMRFKGTEGNPWFAYERAEILDPITTMERGLNHIVDSMYMYDMKQFSMEHWLEQAKNYLDLKNPNDWRLNPLMHFYDPQYKDGVKWSAEHVLLETNRRAALDFIGRQSSIDTFMSRLGQSLADSIYGKFKVVIEPLTKIPSMTTWGRWAKNTAFYMYMSGFSTFFTQAASMANIALIAGPENASKATAAMTMYGLWKRFSGRPEILDAIDRELANKFGWKPGRFAEATRMMEGAGISTVGSEHAFKEGGLTLGMQSMDSINNFDLAWKTTQKAGKTLLNVAGMPFEYGAATTRISGFYTAYLEHLEKAPGGVIDRQLQSSMLARAVLLDMNMTKAHNSRLQNNFSVPMQFRSYDIRMAQMMWGKNLTQEEKMRMFAFSSMMYGARGGYLALLGFPVADYTLEKLQEMGYIPGENHLADIAVNGFPSWMFAMLSGFQDPQGKKTWYDYSNWGTRGTTQIADFFDNDHTIAGVLAGVAGSAFDSTWKNTYGVRKAIWDMGTPDGYKLTSEDILHAFDSIKAVGDVRSAYLALKYGEWFSKNEAYITDISKVNAWLKLFTGVKPIIGSDVFYKEKAVKSLDDDIKSMQGHLNTEIVRAMLAHKDNNKSLEETHMKNATAILMGIPQHKWGEARQSAFRAAQIPSEDRINKKLYMEMQNKIETLARINQMKSKK